MSQDATMVTWGSIMIHTPIESSDGPVLLEAFTFKDHIMCTFCDHEHKLEVHTVQLPDGGDKLSSSLDVRRGE